MNLTELQKADPETWAAIMQWKNHENVYDPVLWGYAIQGELQRSIEKRGWGFQLMRSISGKCLADISTGSDIMDGKSCDSPAEALLQAYTEAVNHES